MEREYVWEADYGERHQLKEALKKLLHEQDASSLQALLVFANNNIYNLELFVAALYADPKKGHIEKMMHVFEEARLVQRKDITIMAHFMVEILQKYRLIFINQKKKTCSLLPHHILMPSTN